MTILVTGGAGFIGANFILDWVATTDEPVVNLDALTYAGNRGNLSPLDGHARHLFVEGNIGDQPLVETLLRTHGIRAVINFAAESHVDRSIAGPAPFFETNVMATLRLLEAVRSHIGALAPAEREAFRFLHVSTDEVFGTLEPDEPAFTEETPYRPNSPYSASKAASDHMVRAYAETYGLKALITNCSNNYGPLQFPEKLVPLIIHRALGGKELPVYGDGRQVRDWLYVGDHCSAIRTVLGRGAPGSTYTIGGNNQMENIALVQQLCAQLDARRPRADGRRYAEQIRFVTDRPGHDRRYAINADRIGRDLGWKPAMSLETGLRQTVDWYLANEAWVETITSGAYRDWVRRQYA